MPDDPNNAQDPNAAAGATPPAGGTPSPAAGQQPAPQVKTFTQEEVNQLVGKARQEAREGALKTKATEATTPPAGQQQQGQQQNAAAPDVTSIVQQAVAAALQAAGVDPFTQAARTAGYSDAQILLARQAHAAAKPDDTGKWLAEWPTQVGMQIKQQGTPAGAGSTAAASQGGAPRKVEDMRNEAGLIDVFSLTADQVLTLGPARIREEFEKTLAVQRARSGAPPLPAAMRRK